MHPTLIKWFSAPIFAGDVEKNKRARLLANLLATASLFLILSLIAIPVGGYAHNAILVLTLVMLLANLFIFRLLHSDKLELASRLILIDFFIFPSAVITIQGTIRSPATATFICMIIVAGILYEDRGVWLSTLAASLAVGAVILGDNLGLLAEPNLQVGTAQWVSYTAIFGVAGSLTLMANHFLREALQRNHQELAVRRQVEESLRLSEAKYRAILNNIHDDVVLTNVQSDIIFKSPGFARQIGLVDDEPINLQDLAFIHPEDRPRLVEAYQQLAASPNGVVTSEYRIQQKDGSYSWVETRFHNLLNDPDVGGVIITSRDISERVASEQARRSSEALFRAVVDNSSDGVVMLDKRGKIKYVSSSFSRVSGYSVEEALGSLAFTFIHPDDLHEALSLFNRARKHHDQRMTAQFRIRHKLEHWVWVESSATNLLDDPHARAIVFNNRDIGDRLRAQEALLESQQQLHAVLQTAGEAIITMNAQLHIAFWNAAAEQMFGYNADEVIGAPVTYIMPDGHGDPLGAGSSLVVEATGLRKDKHPFPVEVSYAGWETSSGHFVTAILRDITERKQHQRELNAITSLSAALRTAPTSERMMPILTNQLVRLLNVDAASVELIDPINGDVIVEAAHGPWENLLGSRQPRGTGINAIISQTLQPYETQDLDNDPNLAYPEWVRYGIRGASGMPLIAQEKLIGFMWIGRKAPISRSDILIFSAISNLAANAIHRANLHEQTLKLASDLSQAYDTTLQGWAGALELRDQETEGHSRRVVAMTLRLANRLGLPDHQLESLRHGAILHDIGKMGVPDAILHKPGPLTAEEWETMRKHPEYAYQLLSPIEHLRSALEIPYSHHEKWDGTGYPRGLKGEDIPLAARMFSVVDVWDALRFDRPYRKAWPEDQIITYLRSLSGSHFDPQVVTAFLEVLSTSQAEQELLPLD